MPIGNNFQHAEYSRSNPGDRVDYKEVEPWAPPDSQPWHDALARHGTALSQAGVEAIVFVHGSWLGTDLFGMQRLDEAGGLKRGYSRGIPGMEALLSLMREDTNGLGPRPQCPTLPLNNDEQTKKSMDEQANDAANFTTAYVNLFEKAVNRELSNPIHCTRYLWCAEHHHLGRAKAACQFLDYLSKQSADLQLKPGQRILVEAHGHAGQVLALVSNVLARSGSSARKALLGNLKAYLEETKAAPDALESLNTIDSLLSEGNLLHGAALDVVTFGTPVRYGWDLEGLGKLLHVVNHRVMRQDGKRWLAKMELPQITMEMPIAWGGDYVQQLAVAGCDAVPADPIAQEANKALWEILEPWDGFERWLECARKSVRSANDGRCVLVDYKDSSGSSNALEHLYGHAAYTRLNNLLFNTSEIVNTLYPSPDS